MITKVFFTLIRTSQEKVEQARAALKDTTLPPVRWKARFPDGYSIIRETASDGYDILHSDPQNKILTYLADPEGKIVYGKVVVTPTFGHINPHWPHLFWHENKCYAMQIYPHEYLRNQHTYQIWDLGSQTKEPPQDERWGFSALDGLFLPAGLNPNVAHFITDKVKAHHWGVERHRIRFCLGDQETGEDWNEENDISGYLGCTMGPIREPILLHNRRSSGGGILLSDCIVKLEWANAERRDGTVIWQHPKYHINPYRYDYRKWVVGKTHTEGVNKPCPICGTEWYHSDGASYLVADPDC